MSEEILYIDDGELVYYINENEFITCDEIPIPMLEGIKHLQQKIEQLEKENISLKEANNYHQEVIKSMKEPENAHHYHLENIKLRAINNQLENIRKEAIEYIENNWITYNDSKDFTEFNEELPVFIKEINILLNILNKGSEENE